MDKELIVDYGGLSLVEKRLYVHASSGLTFIDKISDHEEGIGVINIREEAGSRNHITGNLDILQFYAKRLYF